MMIFTGGSWVKETGGWGDERWRLCYNNPLALAERRTATSKTVAKATPISQVC